MDYGPDDIFKAEKLLNKVHEFVCNVDIGGASDEAHNFWEAIRASLADELADYWEAKS